MHDNVRDVIVRTSAEGRTNGARADVATGPEIVNHVIAAFIAKLQRPQGCQLKEENEGTKQLVCSGQLTLAIPVMLYNMLMSGISIPAHTKKLNKRSKKTF